MKNVWKGDKCLGQYIGFTFRGTELVIIYLYGGRMIAIAASLVLVHE